ncbi:MAG: GspH/FimT family pseudopilin [Gammaproteobacteria bacterium]
MKNENGFTLVELMVTMTVAVILLALAVPAFHDFVQANRISAQANELVTAINLARSEALKRTQTVTVCKSKNGTSCGDGSVSWVDGWIVFSDQDGDNTINGNDQLLRVWDAMPAGSYMAASPTPLQYSGIGLVNNSAQFVFTIPERTGDLARCINITVTGHPSVTTEKDPSCTAPAIP